MWHAPDGLMTLHGPVAEIIRRVLDHLIDVLDPDEPAPPHLTETPAFDRHPVPTQLALLQTVGAALLRDEVPVPSKRASTDAAVEAMLMTLEVIVTDEARTDLDAWRRLLINAALQVGAESVPTMNARLPETWEDAVASLRVALLPDKDIEMEDDLADRSPEQVAQITAAAGIPPEYYSAPPPDPTPEQLPAIVADLRELAGAADADATAAWADARDEHMMHRRGVEVSVGDWVGADVQGSEVHGRVVAMTGQLAVLRVERIRDSSRASRAGRPARYDQGQHVAAPWEAVFLPARPAYQVITNLETHWPELTGGAPVIAVDRDRKVPRAVFWDADEARSWAKTAVGRVRLEWSPT